jgi:hypothetical protein
MADKPPSPNPTPSNPLPELELYIESMELLTFTEKGLTFSIFLIMLL